MTCEYIERNALIVIKMTCEYIERNALIVIKMTCEHMECIASIVIESGKYEYKYMKFDIHDSIDEGGVS